MKSLPGYLKPRAQAMSLSVEFSVDVESIRRKLRELVSGIDRVLSERERLRDAMIKRSRDVIRLSGWIVNAIHRGDLDAARRYMAELEEAVREFLGYARSDPTLYHSGLVHNTLAEYVEATVFYRLVTVGELPGYQELGVDEVSYLQGIGDVIGELRRLALDLMRVGRLDEAGRILDLMEAMYYELRGLEYPEALIPGVKHKVDVARRLIDDTKALLLEVKGRREVLEALERYGGSRGPG